MTDTERDTERYAETQVTWCMTHNGYASEKFGCSEATHDHYDVVLDQHGKVLFRVWPVGTTWRTADGYTMRLRRYDQSVSDMLHLDSRDVPARPLWDGQTPSGGGFSESQWLPGPDDVIVEYALDPEVRPAPGTLYVRPNGEGWRLRGYYLNMLHVGPKGENVYMPTWSKANFDGSQSDGGYGPLPDDARLVWHP